MVGVLVDGLSQMLGRGGRMEDKDRGLYHKYRVERTDGKPVGFCLVLELEDQGTWQAMRQYAATVRQQGFVALASDIDSIVCAELAKSVLDVFKFKEMEK